MIPPPGKRVPYLLKRRREIIKKFITLLDAIHGNVEEIDRVIIAVGRCCGGLYIDMSVVSGHWDRDEHVLMHEQPCMPHNTSHILP